MPSDLTGDFIEECRRLISIRSDPERGTKELVLHLAPFCSRLGFHLTFQGGRNGDASRELNLLAHTVPTGSSDLCPNGLLLVTHLDTVPAGDSSLWTETGGNPFQPVIRADRIYGLGSADTKLDFLCKLKAIENIVGAYRDTPLHEIFKIPLALVGTFGEERALAGVRLLRETGVVYPKFALVGEPSQLEPVIAHKGILYMRAVYEPPHPASGHPLPDIGERDGVRGKSFLGRAAHGATPHLGENAVLKAIRWLLDEQKENPNLHLEKIDGGTVHNIVPERCEVSYGDGKSPCPRINFLKKFFRLLDAAETTLTTHRNDAFDPPRTTCNVGVIRGDRDRIEIEFDFRMIPETDGNELFTLFQRLSNEVPGARVEVIRSNAPMNTGRQSEIAKRVGESLKAVNLPLHFGVKSGNTEGTILNQMGAESIVIGPGRSVGNIHAPNEYNEISQLQKAVEFYAAFLRQFC